MIKKVYLIVDEWSIDNAYAVHIEAFANYDSAVEAFHRSIETTCTEISWIRDAFDDNGDIKDDYCLNYNTLFRDNKEHELWWRITQKDDWNFHDNIELRILEVYDV